MFLDRAGAGKALAEEVARHAGPGEKVVVALPRGGVPVAFEVARTLGAPLLVMPVAKVGAPGREELAVGAVAPGGVEVLNEDVVAAMHLGHHELRELVARAMAKVSFQMAAYNGPETTLSLQGRAVVVVDDGLATGASMPRGAARRPPAGPRTRPPRSAGGAASCPGLPRAARRRRGVPCPAGADAGSRRLVRGLHPDHGRRGSPVARGGQRAERRRTALVLAGVGLGLGRRRAAPPSALERSVTH